MYWRVRRTRPILAGQAMIQQWHQFLIRPDVRSHVAFLSDYDMTLSQHLVQGVDLWINTPRRPWEASGTSGMKILANGGMNLSELDGWWVEAYSPEVGWAIGDGQEHGDDPNVDAAEAETLYELLEREIVPKFYERDQQGIPTQWIAMMRESMARLTPVFSANRTVREYTEKHYLPGAAAYCARAAERASRLRRCWNGSATWLRIGRIFDLGKRTLKRASGQHVFEVQVYLDDLDADAVRVELYADAADGDQPIRQVMQRGVELLGSQGGYAYSAWVPATRPASDYTPRVVPFRNGAFVPLEADQILWQR